MPLTEMKTVEELLTWELHRQYRATAKHMGLRGAIAHDHGPIDCGNIKMSYFRKRAKEIIRRSTMSHPENLGEAEQRLNAMILLKRSIVEAPKFIVCQLCAAEYDTWGGITTTQGYFCYSCVKRIHVIADQTVALRERPKADILSDIDATT